MNYKFIGKLSQRVVDEMKLDIISRYRKLPKAYQIIRMSPSVTQKFKELIFPYMFDSENVKVRDIKVFITPPYFKFGVHKDGLDRLTALNIVIDCNDTDWVRWYTDEMIEKAGGVMVTQDEPYHSRNVPNLENFEDLPFTQEVTGQEPGNVYLLDTNEFHAFKNNGPRTRFIVQTKFDDNPCLDEVLARITETGLPNVK